MIVVAGQCLQNAPSEGGRVVGRMFSHVFGHGLRFRMFECVCAFVRARVCHGCGRNVRMLTRQLVSHSRFVAARPSARSASETSPWSCHVFASRSSKRGRSSKSARVPCGGARSDQGGDGVPCSLYTIKKKKTFTTATM